VNIPLTLPVDIVVTLVSEKTNVSLGISSQMLTVLGIVLGLVVSFRTTSAYDRCVLALK
jgi:predicted membrane chloride channel (bestrophin family)